MILLSWRDDYRVGLPQIDSEHRYLFGLVNEFHDQYGNGGNPQQLMLVLNRLVAYAEKHFRHEEALMQARGYPRLAHHQELHERLYSSIYAVHEKQSSDTGKADAALVRFLKNFIYHILNEDLNVGEFLRRKAAQPEKSVQVMPGKNADEIAGADTATKGA